MADAGIDGGPLENISLCPGCAGKKARFFPARLSYQALVKDSGQLDGQPLLRHLQLR
jgi:hypothetical protein